MIPKYKKLITFLQDAAALLILLAVALLLIKKMWVEGIFYEAHDIRHHTVWLQHFHKQLSEGIIYPRWLAETNYGYGSPTFVFYPPLLYYCGSILLAVGVDIQKTIATLCFLAIYGAGITSYLYCRYQTGPLIAFVGAITYSTAPYIIFNVFVRCALAEAWALILIPIGFLVTELSLKNSRFQPGIAVFYALLTLTHLPSLLIFTIIWLPYVGILSQQHPRPFKYGIGCLSFMILGCLSVAFYLLPVLFERSLVNLDSMKNVSGGYLENFIIANVPSEQSSIQKVMSIFNRTLPLLIFSLTIGAIRQSNISLYLNENKRFSDNSKIRLYAALTGLIIFLISSFSIPIWKASSTLQMIQFPWRMLGIFSLLAAAYCSLSVSQLMNFKYKKISTIDNLFKAFSLMFLSFLILSNAHYSLQISRSLPGYNRPGNLEVSQISSDADRRKLNKYQYLDLAISQPFTGQLTDAFEYLPIIAETGEAAPLPKPRQPIFSVIEGRAEVKLENWQSYSRKLLITASEPAKIQLRTYYYPAWRAYVNGNVHPTEMSEAGQLLVSLEPGKHELFMKYQRTPALIGGIVISVICSLFIVFKCVQSRKLVRS